MPVEAAERATREMSVKKKLQPALVLLLGGSGERAKPRLRKGDATTKATATKAVMECWGHWEKRM